MVTNVRTGNTHHFESQKKACDFIQCTPITLKRHIADGDEVKGYFVDYEYNDGERHLSEQSVVLLRRIVDTIRDIEKIENIKLI